MRTGPPSASTGLFHEGAIFASDGDFAELAVPFVLEGVAAGEPTYVVVGSHNTALIRREVGEPNGVHYLASEDAYVKPATTVKGYLRVLGQEIERGAEQIRFITEVPHPGQGVAWDWWGRYESAANHIFRDVPLWAICSYDQRTTPESVLEEVVQSHPFMAGPGGGHDHNASYQDSSTFLDRRSCRYRDPAEDSPPAVNLLDPTAAQARSAAARVASAVVGPAAGDDLALAVSEVVGNAYLHGRPPVRLRIWAAPERVVAAVSDQGTGVTDVAAGLAPVGSDELGGRGLWIASQLCNHLTMETGSDGFTIRLVMGTPLVCEREVARSMDG